VVIVFFVCVVVHYSQDSEFLRVYVNVCHFPLFDLHCYLQGSEICIFLTLMFPRCVQVYGLIVLLHIPRKQGKEANINISPYTVTKSATVMSQFSTAKTHDNGILCDKINESLIRNTFRSHST